MKVAVKEELIKTLKTRFEKNTRRHEGIDWKAVQAKWRCSQLTKREQPSGSSIEMTSSLGIEMLTEAQYREPQKLGEFDTKTSSWVKTPPDVRRLGSALFCDRRYGQVFVYHNSAESYYAARGFRGVVSV